MSEVSYFINELMLICSILRYIAAFMKLESNFRNSLVPYLKEAMSSAKRDMMSKSSSLFSHYVISLLDMYLLFLYTISTNAPSLIPPHFYIYVVLYDSKAASYAYCSLNHIWRLSFRKKPEKFEVEVDVERNTNNCTGQSFSNGCFGSHENLKWSKDSSGRHYTATKLPSQSALTILVLKNWVGW